MPSETFTTPNVWHRFIVPAGVDRLGVEVKGAGNGNEKGGLVSGIMTCEPGQVYWIAVGQQGIPLFGYEGGAPCWGGGGGGGNGHGPGKQAGGGGAGGSGIKLSNDPNDGSSLGWMRVVAGGAGGRSGDGGAGGEGGADQGQRGQRGNDGTKGTTAPEGGDQITIGLGGKNGPAGPGYDGGNSDVGPLGRAGHGGQVGHGSSNGGGGGGGGWNGGGGGSASGDGAPGTGGGGGSNFARGLIEVTKNERGGGNAGAGSVYIEWNASNLPDANPENAETEARSPSPPSNLKVQDKDLTSDTTTKAMTAVTFTAELNAQEGAQAQMVVRLVPADNDDSTEEWNFGGSFMTFVSDWTGVFADNDNDVPVSVTATGLQPNQKYYVRAYTLDSRGLWSRGMGDDPDAGGFSAGSFWTNRTPSPPTLVTPTDNRMFTVFDNIQFGWTPVDEDEADTQSEAQVRVRRLTRPNEGVITDWVTVVHITDATPTWTTIASDFTGNQFYIWAVRTADSNHVWSEWSRVNSFFVEAGTTPPIITSPRRGEAVVSNGTSVFRWEFLDPIAGTTQSHADIRIRVVGTEEWITYYGEPDPAEPGSIPEWLFPLDTFVEGYHYEWQVRTYNATLQVSDWSVTEDFWATAKPGEGIAQRYLLPEYESVQPPLGCGVSRVYVFDRGGEIMRGEITPLTTLRYGRTRDDISTCTLFVNGFGKDCGALLSEIRSWMHEIVVFRDGKRVWEGPITRVTEENGQVEIEAKDVMAYVYRRIMRQGYNDTYHEVNGVAKGGLSVVRRAALTVMNALAYDDPNVLRWMTEIRHSDDAIQHRAVPDFSKMAWEEIDDLAANAGLDYTTLGRRIVFWDTHRALGRLPEMRDEHFSQPVHVTEYGMQLANFFAVTNNDGVYGTASRGMGSTLGARPPYYGWVEQLVSAFGESEGDEKEVLTEKARVSLEETLAKQADRGIAPRWPTPLVVRVPDNATLNPDINLGFDQLVPGVWIPVHATRTIRKVSQWQKLDSVTVEQTGESGERIMVSMSPAPNGGTDPDADAAAVEAAG